MKSLIGIKIVFSLLVLSVVWAIYYEAFYMKTVTVRGTVVSHGLVADKYGDRTYITLIKTDDGQIVEKTDMDSYIIPVNQKVKVEVRRSK